MRQWRRITPLTKEQRRKDNVRSHARVARKRGTLKAIPCQICGDPEVEMHHHDYDKPLDVIWLCRSCHLEYHRYADG